MNKSQSMAHIRGVYMNNSFDLQDCLDNPVGQFSKWFEEAVKAGCEEPNAFTLSTIMDGRPRARIVLLKGIDKKQFVFYTNYFSSKGTEIEHNPHVAMTFLWPALHRQVRIEGIASKVDNSESDDYFSRRPRGSQIGAHASPQSQRVSTRKELEDRFVEFEKKFEGITDIPRPSHWGGYAITPDFLEFWQGRENRMHDRISYILENGNWSICRLAP